MSAAERYLTLNSRDLRLELEELYAAYTGCLDEERFEEWPEFFVEHCLYKIIPRENFERGLPLATWLCESKGYLADRVTAIRKTAVYAPRYVRRMVSGIRVLGWKERVLEVRANYVALETLQDELTRVFNTGQYCDKLVVEEGRLKFKEKVCIFNSLPLPNSPISPLRHARKLDQSRRRLRSSRKRNAARESRRRAGVPVQPRRKNFRYARHLHSRTGEPRRRVHRGRGDRMPASPGEISYRDGQGGWGSLHRGHPHLRREDRKRRGAAQGIARPWKDCL